MSLRFMKSLTGAAVFVLLILFGVIAGLCLECLDAIGLFLVHVVWRGRR
jgi:hypothetical protein